MRKIPYLPLSFAALLISLVILVPACGTFQGPGEYKTPEDYLDSLPTPKDEPFDTLTFLWPVENPQVTRGYRPPSDSDHEGIDLRGSRGTPIYATQKGRIVYANQGVRGYGRMVLIEHNNHWASLYAHLTKILVKKGDEVLAGQIIGTMGNSGRATGVHLHFELIRNKRPVNPIDHLPKRQMTSIQ